jgi:hypothetical protein
MKEQLPPEVSGYNEVIYRAEFGEVENENIAACKERGVM